MVNTCDQCGEVRQLTHKIKSDVLDMTVCYSCGVQAEVVQGAAGCPLGSMTITIFEAPTVIPIFFECSLCHGHFKNEHAYQRHWYDQHT